MGNTESSSQFPPPSNNNGNNKKPSNLDQSKMDSEEEEETNSSLLKVGAAIAGTALLALGAFSVASSSSSHPKPEGFGSSSGNHGYQIPRNRRPCAEDLIKILSYNVWFREDMEVRERMIAIGQLVQEHSPDIIFFQEVTPNIYKLFQHSNWWRMYRCSVLPEKATRIYFCMLLSKLPVKRFLCKPFKNSQMGRELCVAEVDAGMNKKLFAATSHLESPTPPEMNSLERVHQAKEALSLLNSEPNVIFGGDMNWDEINDRPFPLLGGWCDAWSVLRPGENGWTYDTRSNGMLKGNRPLSKRLDRFVCKLQDFKMVSVDIIGMGEIPGISAYNNRSKEVPVLPSDHYGLVLVICPK